MSVTELKTSLTELINTTDDVDTLEQMIAFYRQLHSHEDWWNELSPEQQAQIKKGSLQASEGQVVSKEQVREAVKDLWTNP
jgi:predicted transcriptional regulator